MSGRIIIGDVLDPATWTQADVPDDAPLFEEST